MEAPVPASALIHSATLVSAGIFLLIRFNNLIELSYYSNTIVLLFGSITAFYGGIVSATQSDTKKTLAYSTISHCGFLMLVYSTGAIEYTILYLYVHGFFKAATFLCIGNVNRFTRNIQDFRKMGNLYKYLPFECMCSFICLTNLGGLPLTLGFFIKHLLFIGCADYFFIFYIIYGFILVGALSGIFYSYRLFYSIFFDIKKNKIYIYNQSFLKNLNSVYYTNTSLLSNISISILIILSYYIILYLYCKLLNYNYSVSDIKVNYNYNLTSYFYEPSLNFLNKLSILN
jgi:NADH:ubiquinone oxidoreductase subunit 5 (subunit L)/multisubunit Na+/H+ antiporter MnhA subunit